MEDTEDRILERSTEDLPVRLTIEELAERGTTIGRRMESRDLEEARFDEVKERHKATLKHLDAEIGRLGRTLHTGIEYREVATVTVMNWTGECVETIREDTGAVVRSRPLLPEEKQHELFRRKDPEAGALGNAPRVPDYPEADKPPRMGGKRA